MHGSRAYCSNIRPAIYIVAFPTVIADYNDRTVCFQPNGLRGACADSDNIRPVVDTALVMFAAANSDDRPVRFKSDRMIHACADSSLPVPGNRRARLLKARQLDRFRVRCRRGFCRRLRVISAARLQHEDHSRRKDEHRRRNNGDERLLFSLLLPRLRRGLEPIVQGLDKLLHGLRPVLGQHGKTAHQRCFLCRCDLHAEL